MKNEELRTSEVESAESVERARQRELERWVNHYLECDKRSDAMIALVGRCVVIVSIAWIFKDWIT